MKYFRVAVSKEPRVYYVQADDDADEDAAGQEAAEEYQDNVADYFEVGEVPLDDVPEQHRSDMIDMSLEPKND